MYEMRLLIVITVLSELFSWHECHGYKILGIYPLGGSHYLLGSTFMRALAEKGHDVTVISVVGEKNPTKNGSYRDISIKDLWEQQSVSNPAKNRNFFDRSEFGYFKNMYFMYGVFTQWPEKVLNHPEVQKLLRSNEKFDAVIVEQFLNDGLKAIASHFKAPLIVSTTQPANLWVNNLVANPAPPSYIPVITANLPKRMDFLQRVESALDTWFQNMILQLYFYPKQDKLVRETVPGSDFYESLYGASIVFLNSHPSMNQAVPHVPNMIEIGGFHIKEPKKLPDHLQKFLDSAQDGAIYFSMGSFLKSTELTDEKRDAIVKTFAKLKQKVLWKWEDDNLPGRTSNIKVEKWLPQQEILNHPNVKLFISHGGMSSAMEAVNFGVPILGIPVFGDQRINIRGLVDLEMGLSLPYTDFDEDKFSRAINELLYDPKYYKNAKHRAELFHDRLIPPLEEAIYWVEYVARHKGAPHLRVTGLDLPWFKYHLLDVIAFLALISLVILYVNYLMIKLILRKLFGIKKSRTRKVKKK